MQASLRRGARESLSDCARYVFRLRPDPHHRVILHALEGVESGAIDKLLVIAPPGHAKSTYVSIVYPTWYAGRHPNESLIAVTTTDRLGALYGDTVKNIIESGGEWSDVFPDVKPDKDRGWSRDGLFLKGPKRRRPEQKDSTLIYTGAGGPVIGRRADGAVIDDIVDEATARSEVALPARKTWLARTIFSRLQGSSKGWRIIAGTLWAEDDVVDSAMRTGEYVTVHMAAESPGGLVCADVWVPNGVSWRPHASYDDEEG